MIQGQGFRLKPWHIAQMPEYLATVMTIFDNPRVYGTHGESTESFNLLATQSYHHLKINRKPEK